MARPREFDEDRVLDAVMETFWRNGYEATSAQNLVDATGLGRGSLYAAYANKDGLFERALLRYRKRAQQHVDQLHQAGSAMQRLHELMVSIVDADLDTTNKCGCLATNSAIEMAGRDPRVAELVRQNFAILTCGIEDTIRRGQQAGEIRADGDATILAFFIFNAIQGLRVLAKTTPQRERKKLIAIVEQTMAALP
ncbi:TetR/AcrR family transcriptional regulator (plasmid) [Rhizobium sp. CB3171]|uniref:TetR/AcrR family transcriptional regulator n=1 Tax=Rhizobium sp. CB3171 TaxID=3039157 RepID=UPI0024B24F74|nr:TetR/AcrR family transcriptional regulator [Rhizobium sp. CB3171]WFU07207.1 TetR/AcrR family transcriptional regulator [Rhizobium sp. CB3171]